MTQQNHTTYYTNEEIGGLVLWFKAVVVEDFAADSKDIMGPVHSQSWQRSSFDP